METTMESKTDKVQKFLFSFLIPLLIMSHIIVFYYKNK